MRIDKVLREFIENYDDEAIDSIERLSMERSLVLTESTFKSFDINESFNKFNSFINGYCEYKIKNKNNDNASPQNAINKSFDKFLDTKVIVEYETKYSKIPEFIESYIVAVNNTIDVIDSVKDKMFIEDVDYDSIAVVNDYADNFIEKVNENFYPIMNKILWASGYNSKKRFEDIVKNKKEKHIFL